MVASETGRTEGTVETLPALAFGASGPDYTAEAIAAARERALLRGVRHIIVATSRGETARKVLEAFPEPEYNLVACFPPAVRPNLTKLFGAMADVTPGHLRVQQELNRAGSDEIQYGCPPDLRDHPRLKVVSDGFDHLGHTVFAQVPASLAKAQFFKEQDSDTFQHLTLALEDLASLGEMSQVLPLLRSEDAVARDAAWRIFRATVARTEKADAAEIVAQGGEEPPYSVAFQGEFDDLQDESVRRLEKWYAKKTGVAAPVRSRFTFPFAVKEGSVFLRELEGGNQSLEGEVLVTIPEPEAGKRWAVRASFELGDGSRQPWRTFSMRSGGRFQGKFRFHVQDVRRQYDVRVVLEPESSEVLPEEQVVRWASPLVTVTPVVVGRGSPAGPGRPLVVEPPPLPSPVQQ